MPATLEVQRQASEATAEPVPPYSGPRGTLRVALTGDPNSLYTPIGADQNADNAASQLYDSLVYLTPEGKIEPALAERWEISPDGSEYVFTLRKGVTFHNGETFTVDDVVATWEYGKRPENQYSNPYADAISVEPIDDYTVRITTDGPNPLFLTMVQDFWNIIPDEYMNEVGVEGFQKHPVGTGPFMFEEWVRGDQITLKANPNYWREGYPLVETVVFRPLPESSIRVAALQEGQIDIVQRLSASEAQVLRGTDGVEVIEYPLQRVYYIAFNNLTTGAGQPTEDAKVRQAMNYAVDVNAIIDALFEGYGKRASSFVATGELGYGVVEPFAYDADKARQLLAAAGYAGGFSMDMACPAGAYGSFEEVCNAVAFYLEDVGISVDLEIMESTEFWDLEARKELPPLFGDSWGSSGREAYDRLIGALGGREASYSAWADPVILDLLDQIGSTPDQGARAKLYQELQVYMQENPPFIYLYEPVTFEAINSRVQNYHPLGGEDYWLFDTWVLSGE
jgi:peptide/nickel transport system substrate-binding protein